MSVPKSGLESHRVLFFHFVRLKYCAWYYFSMLMLWDTDFFYLHVISCITDVA